MFIFFFFNIYLWTTFFFYKTDFKKNVFACKIVNLLHQAQQLNEKLLFN